MSEPTSMDLTVRRHKQDDKSGKDTIYEVGLISEKDANPHVKVVLKSTNLVILEQYPMDQRMTVRFIKPQQSITEHIEKS